MFKQAKIYEILITLSVSLFDGELEEQKRAEEEVDKKAIIR